MELYDQVAAISYIIERPEDQVAEIFVQHLQPMDLKAMLSGTQLPFAVQRFSTSKQIKNTVYKCSLHGSALTPGAVEIEKLQNSHSFFDFKVPLDQRTPTFEDNAEELDHSDKSNIPQQLQDNICKAVRQVKEHLA